MNEHQTGSESSNQAIEITSIFGARAVVDRAEREAQDLEKASSKKKKEAAVKKIKEELIQVMEYLEKNPKSGADEIYTKAHSLYDTVGSASLASNDVDHLPFDDVAAASQLKADADSMPQPVEPSLIEEPPAAVATPEPATGTTNKGVDIPPVQPAQHTVETVKMNPETKTAVESDSTLARQLLVEGKRVEQRLAKVKAAFEQSGLTVGDNKTVVVEGKFLRRGELNSLLSIVSTLPLTELGPTDTVTPFKSWQDVGFATGETLRQTRLWVEKTHAAANDQGLKMSPITATEISRLMNVLSPLLNSSEAKSIPVVTRPADDVIEPSPEQRPAGTPKTPENNVEMPTNAQVDKFLMEQWGLTFAEASSLIQTAKNGETAAKLKGTLPIELTGSKPADQAPQVAGRRPVSRFDEIRDTKHTEPLVDDKKVETPHTDDVDEPAPDDAEIKALSEGELIKWDAWRETRKNLIKLTFRPFLRKADATIDRFRSPENKKFKGAQDITKLMHEAGFALSENQLMSAIDELLSHSLNERTKLDRASYNAVVGFANFFAEYMQGKGEPFPLNKDLAYPKVSERVAKMILNYETENGVKKESVDAYFTETKKSMLKYVFGAGGAFDPNRIMAKEDKKDEVSADEDEVVEKDENQDQHVEKNNKTGDEDNQTKPPASTSTGLEGEIKPVPEDKKPTTEDLKPVTGPIATRRRTI